MTEEEIERFLDELTKPLYVWRMARSKVPPNAHGQTSTPMIRSAQASRTRALRQIRALLDGLHTTTPEQED